MVRKLPELTRNQILAGLIDGKTELQISKELHVSNATVNILKNDNMQYIESHKKRVREQFLEDNAKTLEKLGRRLLDRASAAARLLTDEKIAVGSAPQIATVLGICTDKMQLLTGGITDHVQVQFPTRESMLDYLRAPPAEASPELGRVRREPKPASISTLLAHKKYEDRKQHERAMRSSKK